MANLRREFRKTLEKKQDKPTQMPGILGTSTGLVATGVQNVVWVRVNDAPLKAVNDLGVPERRDLPVWVGYSIHDPQTLRVLNIRVVGSTISDQTPASNKHAETHRLYGQGEGGGTDPLWVDWRQVLPLLPYTTETPMLLSVMPWVVPINGVPTLIGTENADHSYTAATVDLIEYLTMTADKAKYMRITVNTSGALVATEGSEVDITALALTDIPAIPAGTAYDVCAVRLYYGQYEIVQHKDNPDILDLRFWAWHTHGASEVSLAMNDLSDVTITSLADGELLQSATGVWINRTLAEAGIAADDHNHTGVYAPVSHEHVEADITDLSHDAIAIDGITVDLTGIADGQAMIYDTATSKIIAGDAGASLTVEEIDGVPSVANVDTLKITNGTLTDNEDGSVTIQFGDAATDGAAIHDDTAGEIAAITEKATPVAEDMLIIEDSEDTNAKKMIQVGSLPSGGGFATGDIQQVELFRSTLAEVGRFDFSSIPATYDHLLIKIAARSTVAATVEGVRVYFNNDTTETNYATALHYAGAGHDKSVGDIAQPMNCPGANSLANEFTQADILIPWYANTSIRKTMASHFGTRFDASSYYAYQYYVNWENTSAINQITIQPAGYATNKFVAGSICQIIGIKTVA